MASPSSRSCCAIILAALISLPTLPARAQEPSSPISDLIARVRDHVNDLKYEDAIRRGREVFELGEALRPSQRIALRVAMAAAFYPEDPESQQRDSAIAHLRELVRLMPEARIPIELKWAGLDSLLDAARSSTFAVSVAPEEEYLLVGTDGRGFIDAVATRPARFHLRLVHVGTGRSVMHDSSAVGRRARLAFRSHDGRTALVHEGRYDFVITAVDAETGDSIVTTHAAEATGAAPDLVVPPVLDPLRLRPEIVKPSRARIIAAGAFFSAATIAVASQGRAEEPIRSAFGSDGRATMVGLLFVGASAVSIWRDKGKPSRENIIANALARENHRRAVADAEVENRKRVADFRVTVRIRPEAIR